MRINKPNYDLATYTAHRTFCFMTSKEYPVNTMDIIEKLPNTELATYEEFAEEIYKDIDFVSKKIAKNNDAFTLNRGDKFIIVYNSDISLNIVERIRFTIAHEIGHILLNHFNNGDLILTRGGLSEEKYSMLEREADTFARELLAPTFIMNTEKWKIKDVCNIFDVSKQVAHISLESKKHYPWIKPKYPLRDILTPDTVKFKKRKNTLQKRSRDHTEFKKKHGLLYFFKEPNIYFCDNCHSAEKLYEGRIKICPICGSSSMDKIEGKKYFIFHETKERYYMSYSELKVDETGTLIENCPICGNNHVRDNFCSVCGVPIVNKCSGMKKTDDNWNGSYEENQPCVEALLGSDRYCPKCGAESTFYYHGLLKDWNLEISDPFSNSSIDISDDELPF